MHPDLPMQGVQSLVSAVCSALLPPLFSARAAQQLQRLLARGEPQQQQGVSCIPTVTTMVAALDAVHGEALEGPLAVIARAVLAETTAQTDYVKAGGLQPELVSR